MQLKKINQYIKRNNLNCAKLAKKLGVHRGTVYSWLTGRSAPGVVVAVKLDKISRGEVSVYDWK